MEGGGPQRPVLLVVWGGIGAGKSTGAPMLLQELQLADESLVKVGVDDLVELVPDYRAAVESSDPERREASYMQFRDEAKKLKGAVLADAFEQKKPVYLEWTHEGNLLKFAHGEDSELPVVEAAYDVVLMYVACDDIDGIVRNAARRQRKIPEDTIRRYNLNRTKHFVNAVNGLHRLLAAAERSTLRAFVVQRQDADSPGSISEVTAALPLLTESDEKLTEEEAWAALQAQLVRGSLK